MNTVSNAHVQLIKKSLESSTSCRLDKRKAFERRKIKVTKDPIPQSLSSIEIQIPGKVHIVSSLNATIINPEFRSDKGKVSVRIEQSIKTALDIDEYSNLFNEFFDEDLLLEQLCISKGEFCWHLFIDCVIYESDGAMVDLLSMSMYYLLQNLALPKVNIEIGGEEKSISIDEDAKIPFCMDNCPLVMCIGIIGDCCIVDPSEQESSAIDSLICYAVLPKSCKKLGIRLLAGSLLHFDRFTETVDMLLRDFSLATLKTFSTV